MICLIPAKLSHCDKSKMNININNSINGHPQHPLPAEIQNMSSDDTVCKYCGVSYLIHNEIKKLEEKVEEYRLEVERLHHYNERERNLNEEIQKLSTTSSDLLEKWKSQKKEYENLSVLLEEKNKKYQNHCRKT